MSKDGGPKALQEVVCLIFYKNGKLLLEQRLDKNEFKDRWTFTGGKVEEFDYKKKGDYKESASTRESEEETGLIPGLFSHIMSFEGTSRTGQNFIFHGILIRKWKGRLENREPYRRKLKWIPLGRAAEYIGDTEVDRKVLEYFLATTGLS